MLAMRIEQQEGAVQVSTIASQFHASLSMLRATIERCTDDLWTEPVGKHAFWLVAYHTLFYTDLYLGIDVESFRPQPFHREDENFMGHRPYPPFDAVEIGAPHEKARILGYEDHCQTKVDEVVLAETSESLAAPAGFEWLMFSREELHLYNIRHIQHHTAQLSLVETIRQGQGVDWVAMGSKS